MQASVGVFVLFGVASIWVVCIWVGGLVLSANAGQGRVLAHWCRGCGCRATVKRSDWSLASLWKGTYDASTGASGRPSVGTTETATKTKGRMVAVRMFVILSKYEDWVVGGLGRT